MIEKMIPNHADTVNGEFLKWLSHQDDATKNDIEKMKIAKKLIDEGWTWHERYGDLKHPDLSEKDVDTLLAWGKEKAEEYKRIKTRGDNFGWLVLIGFILAVFYGGWLWIALSIFMAISSIAIGLLGGFSGTSSGDDYPGAAGYDGDE